MSTGNNPTEWIRSSFGGDDETYVRVKTARDFVYISKKDSTGTVVIPLGAWQNFVRGIKKGDFD